jgi:uncharacterized protein involved in exopolysaccharide biosynthesis
MEQEEILAEDIMRDLKDIFLYLFSKWYIILLAGVIGGSAGILYATLNKPKYEAKLTFSLEESGGGLSGALSLAAEFGFNIGGGGSNIFSGDNIINILNSRRIIEEVLLSIDSANGKKVTIADLNMKYSKLDFSKNKKIGPISFPAGLERSKFSYHQDSILFSFYDNIVKNALRIKRPDKRLNYYEITFVSPDERFSKIFIEKLISSATAFYVELKSKRARETLEILEARSEAMRGGVKSAIQKQAKIKDANLNTAFNDNIAAVQKQQVDAAAFGKAYEEIFKTLELARYQYLQNIPLLQIIDEPNYPIKKIKAGRLKTGIIGAFLLGLVIIIILIVTKKTQKA